MIIQIKGKEYKFEFDSVWGPIYTYEELTEGKLPFNPARTQCLHLLFWCILMRANTDFTMMPDEFLLVLNDLDLAGKMMAYYTERMKVLSIGSDMEGDEAEADGKKKD